jgi:DNA-binding NarL/FixJ family response regulator
MPTIAIVEDDAETRSGLKHHVAAHPGLVVVAEAGSVREGIAALDAEPDVLLVDLGLPDGSGIEVIRAGLSRNPALEILVISVFGDERHVVEAIEAGAAGYLLKDADGNAVGRAILDLLGGGSPITPVIARRLLKRFQGASDARTAPDESAPTLTARETEVLRLVSRGYRNEEIAGLLGISFHTVTSHVKHIYRKLAVRSRSEAIFEATQFGLIDRTS